uniref:Uncharacterized protein n=2 Tax=Caenorhabditis japonica TaxID=281687 RepID=A0A8R1E947_CAEJA
MSMVSKPISLINYADPAKPSQQFIQEVSLSYSSPYAPETQPRKHYINGVSPQWNQVQNVRDPPSQTVPYFSAQSALQAGRVSSCNSPIPAFEQHRQYGRSQDIALLESSIIKDLTTITTNT